MIFPEAIVRLTAIRHGVLEMVERKTQTDISRFRIKESELQRVRAPAALEEPERQSDVRYCPREILIARIDNALALFKSLPHNLG